MKSKNCSYQSRFDRTKLKSSANRIHHGINKIIILLSLGLLAVSCGSVATYKYDISMVNPVISDSLEYKDDKIDISFSVLKDDLYPLNFNGLGFKLINETDKILKINWDEVSIVLSGKAGRVIHKGVELGNKDKAQVPTIIPVNSYWSDFIIPADNTYYTNDWGWRTYPILKIKTMNFEKWNNSIKGMTFSLYFPVYYGDEKIDYNFDFVIHGVTETLPWATQPQ